MVFFLLLNYFNSIKVQLKLILTLRLTKILLIFQFHKGTIKTVVLILLICLKRNFNSIKVQLKL